MSRSQKPLSLITLAVSALFFSTPAAFAQSTVAATPANKSIASTQSGIELQWMDKSVRPQDDFFRYVSGKWLQEIPIPADRARFGAFDNLREQAVLDVHDIVRELAAKKDHVAGSNQQKIADLYNSFMDEARAQELDDKPLLPLLAQVDAVQNKSELLALWGKLLAIQVEAPLQAMVFQDAKDTNGHAVYLSQNGLGLPDRDYYLKEDDAKFKQFRAAYLAHLEKMLTMHGDAKAAASAQSIMRIETALAQIQWSRAEQRDPVKTYNKQSLAELAQLSPGVDWRAYFGGTGMAGKMEYVIVRQPSYLQGLAKLLQDMSLKEWQTYTRWKLLNAYAPFLSNRFVEQHFAFTENTLRGIPANAPRFKRAVARVEEALPEAVGQLYVARHFPPQHRARMQELVNNLLLAYKQSIQTLGWMSDATKQAALEKLAKFTPKIGYPDQWKDYSGLQIVAGDLLGNIMRGRQFSYQYRLAKLGKPVDRNEWNMSPQTVNAYYNPRNNEIVFPAAILQPPFFNPAAEDAINYGGIGGVIGHEISHGFDDAGSQSDGDGNLRDWWGKEDKGNFTQLGDAMAAQYAARGPLPGYFVNGKLTLGENIADNSGLAIAFKAYQLSLGGKAAPVLDGFTGNQRVFIGWAQVWRSKAREEEAIRLLKSDPHSPGILRCNLPLSNSAEFYRAFDVKEGDKMFVPKEKRISIW